MNMARLASMIQASDSHSLQLITRLYDIGIIERGRFTLVVIQHDEWCPSPPYTLVPRLRCNVEAGINRHIYSFEEFVGQSARR
jgi:hypothetical protein